MKKNRAGDEFAAGAAVPGEADAARPASKSPRAAGGLRGTMKKLVQDPGSFVAGSTTAIVRSVGALLLPGTKTDPVEEGRELERLGRERLAAGEYVEAEALLRRAVAVAPELAGAHSALGVALRKSGRLEEASAVFDRALELEPTLFEAQMELGHTHRGRGDHRAAGNAFQAAANLKPKRVDVHYELGRSLRRSGELSRAAEELTTAVRLDATHAPTQQELARVLKALGRDRRALQDVRAAAARDANGSGAESLLRAADPAREAARARLEQGKELARLGKLDEAAHAFQALIETPSAAAIATSARLELGRIRLRQQRHVEASAVVRPVLGESGEARAATLVVARAHVRLKELEAAEQLLQPLLAADPNDFEALIEMRNVHAAAGRYVDAARAAARALNVSRRSAAAGKRASGADDLLRSLIQARMLDDALLVVNDATSDEPVNPALAAALARELGRASRSAEAVELLARVIARTPTAEIYFEYGRALARIQRFEEAESALVTSLELESELVIGWLWLARARRALGRYPEAEAAAREALARGPSADVYVELGRIAEACADYAAAEQHLEAARDLEPSSERAQANLSRVRRKKEGQRRAALMALRARERAARRAQLADATVPGAALRAARARARIIVYTCCFGNYESLKEPDTPDPAVRFIAFTDDPNLRSEHWEICVLNDHLSNPRRSSRLPKILAHLYLPDHDASVYIDASFQWLALDARAMVEECLEGHDIGLYPHFRRSCIYDEIDTCEALGIEHAELISFYRSHYESLAFPRGAGLFEHGLIVRRNTAATRILNEAWWQVYLGHRDQLSLMSAIHTTGTKVNPIRHGDQVRINEYVAFVKHERPSLSKKKPKLYVFIAYAPPEYEQDLGRTYNDFMGLIEDDAYALFLDHDAMFCSSDWSELVERLMVGYDGADFLVVGRTNRIGNPYQRVGVLADEHRISAHARLAEHLAATQRDWVANVSELDSTSGAVLMLGKQTWKKTPFSPGFLKVDNLMHIAFRRAGRPVFMPASLYVYHFYRADGDQSHAVRLEDPPDSAPASSSSGGEHRLKTFVYDESAGLDFAHYGGLLCSNEWAIFLRADAMFCDKHWYARAYGRLGGLPGEAVVLFGNNAVDEAAPRSDDVLLHRDYAAQRVALPGPRSSSRSEFSADDLIAFMISKPVLDRLVAEGGRGVADLQRLLGRSSCAVFEDASTHVFSQAGVLATAVDASLPSVADLSKALLSNRRVAILTLGFWPSQAGMELMIHNLAVHLTLAGDLVALYAPKPSKSYQEIPHNYLLKRFESEEHFLEMFRRQHDVLPFDVILAQGGLEAASMALTLKEELGIPVVLRTHGEDIQVDESTGYGYRLDPAKRAIIDSNIQRVDRHIVIGEHVAPLIKEIAPDAIVTTIHNGVDTERLRPQESRYIRDRLNLGDDRLIVLTVGRNVKKKAFHLAVHTLKLVLERVPNAVLVHAGRDGNGENLAALAEELGVAHAFFRLGEVNYFDMPLVYAGADLFLFPSKVETFGNVTVEALSSGLPCVEFDYSVNRHKISSGHNGYVVPFGDVQELADRTVELLLDADKRRAFSLEARKAAEETFAWPRVAENYRSVFQAFRNVALRRSEPVAGYGVAPFTNLTEELRLE